MNCTELHRAAASAVDSAISHDAAFVALLAALFLVSASLLTHGERLVRPYAAVIGGVLGGGTAFALAHSVASSLPCEARVAIAASAGIALAALAVCMLKTGLFLLGAFGLGAVAHLAWESLPLAGVRGPFAIGGRPGWYYAAVGGSATVGALVAQARRRHFLRIASAVLGGVGLACGVQLAYARGGAAAPPAVLLLVAVAASIAGASAQHYCAHRRKARRARGRRPIAEGVPMGRRVA